MHRDQKYFTGTAQPIGRHALFIVLALYVSLWIVYPKQFIASDPWAYSLLAHRVTQGNFLGSIANHVTTHRLAVFLPVSLFYKIFGVNIFSTNLWPLISTLIIMVVVWSSLSEYPSRIFALLFCSTSVLLFKQSVSLYPDIIATSFMALSSLFLFYRKKVLDKKFLNTFYPVLAVLFLFIAFMAKMSAYWVLPLWIYAFITDLKESNYNLIRRFYLPVVISALVVATFYFVICDLIWGNPLARFYSIQNISTHHLWTWKELSLITLFKRFTIWPVRLFLSTYGIIPILSLFSIWILPRRLRFWACYVFSTLLFFWFGTTSFTTYQPMPMFPRMTLPLLPGMAILAGHSAGWLFVKFKNAGHLNTKVVFLIFSLIISLPFIVYAFSWPSNKASESHAMKILSDRVYAEKNRKFLLLCSDVRSPKSLQFYFQYSYPKNLDVVFMGNASERRIKESDVVMIFLHVRRSEFLSTTFNKKNYDQKIRELDLKKIFSENGIMLFECRNRADLIRVITENE